MSGVSPNEVGFDDVTAAGFVGSFVYSTIEIIHRKRPLSSEFKSWLAPLLSLVFLALLYLGTSLASGTIFPFPKVFTLAWQAYGHSQAQHNVPGAMTNTGAPIVSPVAPVAPVAPVGPVERAGDIQE